MDGLEDRMDSALRDLVPSCDFRERKRLDQIQENGVIKSLRYAQGRVDPVGSLVERGAAVLAEEPALVEGDNGTAMVIGDVSDRLYSTGVFDDTVVGTTVGTQPLTGDRQIKGDEIIVLEWVDALNGCFLGKHLT